MRGGGESRGCGGSGSNPSPGVALQSLGSVYLLEAADSVPTSGLTSRAAVGFPGVAEQGGAVHALHLCARRVAHGAQRTRNATDGQRGRR